MRRTVSLVFALTLTLFMLTACSAEPSEPSCTEAARAAGVSEPYIALLEQEEHTASERIAIGVITEAFDLSEQCGTLSDEPAGAADEESGTHDRITNADIVATIQAALATNEARATNTPAPTNTPVKPTRPLLAQATKGAGAPQPTWTPTSTATPTPQPTWTPTSTATPTPQPTPTAVPTLTATPAPVPFPYPTATPKPTSTPAPSATPIPTTAAVASGAPTDYSECLDRVQSFSANRHSVAELLPAAMWRCRDYPISGEVPKGENCVSTIQASTARRFPTWKSEFANWYAVNACHDDSRPYPVPVGITHYGACLDGVYEGLTAQLRNVYLALNAAATLCRGQLPRPEPALYQICFDAEREQSRSIYPGWSTLLHDWHSAMLCVPAWDPAATPPNGDAFGVCLTDVHEQVEPVMPAAVATQAAFWRCRGHEPEPGPEDTGCFDATEFAGGELPVALEAWYKFGHCLWPW